MTALDGIERLEAPGLWRPAADAQRQDVYVAIGEAELVLQDRAGAPLTHWSLPALIRLNPGTMPASYAPSTASGEQLDIEEPEMSEALDRVIDAVERGRRKPGRIRRLTVGLVSGFAVGSLLMWLPGALRDHAANVMPAPARVEIGERMLTELTALTGPPCGTILGSEALATLKARVLPTTPARLTVLRDLPVPALALPGGLIVLSDAPLVERDDPDVTAGHVLAAALAARDMPPLDRFLGGLSALQLGRLLASGEVTDEAITTHVEQLLLAEPTPPDTVILRPAFAAAGLAWSPYAEAAELPLGEPPTSPPLPALDDTAWQSLRGICDG